MGGCGNSAMDWPALSLVGRSRFLDVENYEGGWLIAAALAS